MIPFSPVRTCRHLHFKHCFAVVRLQPLVLGTFKLSRRCYRSQPFAALSLSTGPLGGDSGTINAARATCTEDLTAWDQHFCFPFPTIILVFLGDVLAGLFPSPSGRPFPFLDAWRDASQNKGFDLALSPRHHMFFWNKSDDAIATLLTGTGTLGDFSRKRQTPGNIPSISRLR